ncbi:MAG: hypothetical protein HQ522_21795 [Bacteroidetes bacterium]|nr:hypothetical protein [Bacteroidota bacterium]
MRQLLVIILLLGGFIFNLKAEEKKFIAPNNNQITYKGALFVEKSEKKVILNRHTKSFLEHPQTFLNAEKANTQSGVSICFSSNSSEIKVFFEERDDSQTRQKVFGIFKNGKFYQHANGFDFSFPNPDGDKLTEWEIVLPAFTGINFTGLEIDKSADLKSVKCEKKPIYAAIGNSITHGVGQNGAAYLTYPFLLARQKNWKLYNLAVGGSKISWPVANLLKNIEVDVITILWGFNDWNSTFTIENEIRPYYKRLLVELRKVQPNAKIYCILPTTSKNTVPKNGTDTLDDIRNAERNIISNLQSGGDKNLFIINGEELTTINDLNDVVHLSVDGAANFAKQLTKLIN